MPSILLFGATGLMGSHLVVALKQGYANFPLTVYIRNTDDITTSYLTSSVGVNRIVYGDFSESAKISQLSSEHEMIINCGSSWDVSLSKAIIAGLHQRVDEGKSKANLIHISGAGNFIDHRKDGKYNGPPNGNGKVWNDNDEEDMKLVNASMLNGGPDVEVLSAGKTGRINTYIIFPSGVYGQALGPNAGNTLGVIQLLYKLQAEELGFVPYIGDGSAIFETIHVADFPPFVLNVLAEALKTPKPTGSVYSRFYIATSQANTYKDISTAFAKLLHAQGVVNTPLPKSVALEEAGSGEMPNLQASNMLLLPDRATRLGWKPVQEGILEYLQYQFETLTVGAI